MDNNLLIALSMPKQYEEEEWKNSIMFIETLLSETKDEDIPKLLPIIVIGFDRLKYPSYKQFIIWKTPLESFPMIIPNSPSIVTKMLRWYIYVEKYSWAIPCPDVLTKIAKFIGNGKTLSVGCGTAYWESLLSKILPEETSIICTDVCRKCAQQSKTMYNMNVIILSSADAVLTYSDCNVLFISWPPCDNLTGFSAIRRFKGNKIVYIGEKEGGCTGDKNFFRHLRWYWTLYRTIEIPTWPGVNDKCFLYVRKRKNRK